MQFQEILEEKEAIISYFIKEVKSVKAQNQLMLEEPGRYQRKFDSGFFMKKRVCGFPRRDVLSTISYHESPMQDVMVRNILMVQIDHASEDGSDMERKALAQHHRHEGEDAQTSSYEEGDQKKPYKFLENIVLTQDDHPPIRARPRPTSMPDQGETTMRWEVEKGKFFVLGLN